ncbi:unnamed protein product [Musa textilis]
MCSMMCFANLPISFWGYALETAAYLLNRIPTKSVMSTPYEIWNGKKPELKVVKIWGCPTHVERHNPDKLESRTEWCKFVGYPKETCVYYFYHPKDQKVFVAKKAVFLEKEHILGGDSGSIIELSEVGEPKAPFHSQSLFRYLTHKFQLYVGPIEYPIFLRDMWDISEERMLRILILRHTRRLL